MILIKEFEDIGASKNVKSILGKDYANSIPPM